MNEKKLLIIILTFFFIQITFAQTTITIQPGPREGKDTYFKDRTPTLNQGNHPDFAAIAWTYSGIPTTVRSIIDFNFSFIPFGSTIDSAFLSLYHNPTSPNGAQHSTMDGPNSTYISRITSYWDEDTVTWNTQPTISTINQILIPSSTGPYQDYIDIDVTTLVQDMVDNPSTSFGFMINLQTEIYYRSLIFASSDNPDDTNHPKLVVTYSLPNGLQDEIKLSQLKIFPNPTADYLIIELDNSDNSRHSLKIIDIQGQIISSEYKITNSKVKIETIHLKSGMYFIQFESEGEIIGTGKFLIE